MAKAPQTEGRKQFLKEARRIAFAGVVKRLDLHKRIPEFMEKRGWPKDPALEAAITAAIVCYRLGAHAQPILRPASADMLKGMWPRATAEVVFAKEVVDSLELDDFVRPMV